MYVTRAEHHMAARRRSDDDLARQATDEQCGAGEGRAGGGRRSGALVEKMGADCDAMVKRCTLPRAHIHQCSLLLLLLL